MRCVALVLAHPLDTYNTFLRPLEKILEPLEVGDFTFLENRPPRGLDSPLSKSMSNVNFQTASVFGGVFLFYVSYEANSKCAVLPWSLRTH